tara:strand:+ start:1253 stop:1606 length:354 start_codon:yes stop_codon:yes gene_type:complete
MFIIVVIKFIAPSKEEIPARCKLKITRSTEVPECPSKLDNGGYIVHPVPAPDSMNEEEIKKLNEVGNNQKLMLFSLGNAISGAPTIKGTNQLPKPPIRVGITIKNIIITACAVTRTL